MSEPFLTRRNPRIRGYDYSQAGWYFVTLCSRNREELFSTITKDQVHLTPIGQLVESEWLRSQTIRSEIELDAYVIMPNHIHGLVRIIETTGRSHTKGLEKHSLPSLIAGFKSSVTKQLRELKLRQESLWQRGYYEHIIRDEEEIERIRIYILANPARWAEDRDNIELLKTRMVHVA